MEKEIFEEKKGGKIEKGQWRVIQTNDMPGIFFHTPWKDGKKSQIWSPPLSYSNWSYFFINKSYDFLLSDAIYHLFNRLETHIAEAGEVNKELLIPIIKLV